MAEFLVTDPTTGQKLKLTGDSPPTEAELEQIFADQPAPQGRTREQSLARISQLEAEQAAIENEPGAFRSVVGGTLSDLRGLPEAVLQLGTGALATAAGGVSAIPATAFEAARGRSIFGPLGIETEPTEVGKGVIQEFQDIGTFQPRTEVGQRATEAIAAPLEAFEAGADFAGQKILEVTGSPEAATAVKTAVLGAPALFGVRRGGTVKTQPKVRTPRQEVAKSAANEGYVTAPSEGGTVSGTAASLAEGLGGKLKVGQEAVSRNQQVTNNLAGRAVGLPEGVPVTADVLSGIRTQAGQAYEALRGSGQIITDITFRRELSAATSRFKSAARDFPDLAKNEVTGIVDGLRKAEFNAGSGIDAIRLLRDKADVAFRGGDASLGNAYKAAANAIEGTIGRHLGRGSDAALLDSFRNARQQIAETYSVQEALQGRITGEVSATQLAAQLKKGVPLTGDLRVIADFANTFPKAARLFQGEALAFSPLDLAVGATGAGIGVTGVALGAGPAAFLPLATTLARPLLRKAALSDTVQGGVPTGSIRPSGAVTAGAAVSGGAELQSEIALRELNKPEGT